MLGCLTRNKETINRIRYLEKEMSTLDSVIIKNFQSHKASELQFIPGVNVVIGPSDAGKSAIFRALNWVLTNWPLGNAFRSEWGGETRVELSTTDGEVVTRSKDKNTNKYVLGENVLKAFGSDPPEAVQQALEMDEINIQSQTDPPFLLVSSPGEVAQMLNQAASIDDIDVVMAGLKKGHNETRRSIQTGDQWLKDQTEELKQYENLEQLEETVQELENLRRMESSLQSQVSKLTNIRHRAYELETKIEKAKHVDKAAKYLKQAEQEKKKQDEVQTRMTRLEELGDRYQALNERLERTGLQIDKLEEEYIEIAPETCPLCGNPMK